MARKLDAFAVAVGLEYYDDGVNYLAVGDEVTITPNRLVVKEERQYVLSPNKKNTMMIPSTH